MIRKIEGHKNSDGENAPWCIVSHKNGKILSSHKSEAAAEKHLRDIQMFKHMKNEAVLSETGLKNLVRDLLDRFDQFDKLYWSESKIGPIATVTFRTAAYEGAEALAELMSRALNRELKGYSAKLRRVGKEDVNPNGDSQWYATFEVKRDRDMNESVRSEVSKEESKMKMTVEEAKEILKESGKRTINESYLEDVNVEELYALALEALFFADQVHLWHWTCKSGFHHTHLQEVYESLRDFADELVEICLASGKKFQVKANTRELGGDGGFDIQEAIDEIEDFVDQIQATGKVFNEESEITTLIDDEAKALTKELGLLKSFS